MSAGKNIVLAANGLFAQTAGTLAVTSPDLVIDTTGGSAPTLLATLLGLAQADTIANAKLSTGCRPMCRRATE